MKFLNLPNSFLFFLVALFLLSFLLVTGRGIILLLLVLAADRSSAIAAQDPLPTSSTAITAQDQLTGVFPMD
jgi:hypothetical protein